MTCFWGTSALTLATRGLIEVLYDVEDLKQESTHTTDCCGLQNLLYMQIFNWDSTVQPVIFSAACLALLRQRAERHLSFHFNVTQASVLRECTGIFVWN